MRTSFFHRLELYSTAFKTRFSLISNAVLSLRSMVFKLLRPQKGKREFAFANPVRDGLKHFYKS